MPAIISFILPVIPVVLIALLVIFIFLNGYVKAPPDMAYIISGFHKKLA